MDNSPFVTVIMPVLNEATLIEESLGAVLRQDYPVDRLEILVIDGGSGDGTQQLVEKMALQQDHVKLLHNPKRIQAAALNLGIHAACGDIIVRVDGHTLIAPDYVTTCVDYLMAGKADNVGGLMQPVGTTSVGQSVALATTFPFGVGDSKFHYLNREAYVDTVYLGAFWRHTFDKIGYYDENIHINEDYELNYRLRKNGGKILLSPAIRSTYFPRASIPALWRQYFIYGRQKVLTLKKHPSSLRWRQAIPALLVLVLFLSLILGVFWSPVFYLFLLIFTVYLLANLVASTIVAGRGGWKYFPILPVVFAAIHFAWGLGFWAGVLSTTFNRKSQGR